MSEGKLSLEASPLQSKQELLKEGKTFNKQHLTLGASPGRAELLYSGFSFSSVNSCAV